MPDASHDLLVQRIRDLPDRPGIYIFKDAEGKVLYVGKAKSLKKQASSYLVRDHEPRLAAMVSEAADLEFVATDTEAEALLLENNWIKKQKWEAAEGTDYEKAAQLRDTLAEIEAVSQRRKLSSVSGEDVDVFGVYVSGGNAAVAVLVMRGGQVLDRRELFWEAVGDISPEQLLSELLPQFYDRTTFIPKEIHLPVPIEGEEALLEWLCEKKGERVYVRMPSRG